MSGEGISSLFVRFAEVIDQLMKRARGASEKEVHAIAFLRCRTGSSNYCLLM